jgi:transposase-like protein
MKEMSVAEQRYQAILAMIEDGLTVTEVADKAGVTRQTLYNWLRRYASGGREQLADRSHRPRSCPHQMAAGEGAVAGAASAHRTRVQIHSRALSRPNRRAIHFAPPP